MQQLHLVGFTTDLDGLIFSARKDAKSGGFLVALDDRFLSQIKEAIRLQSGVDLDEEIEDEREEQGVSRRRRGRSARHVHSALAPRDIQARLRAGRTVEEVAAEAGVDDEWVMRFATPVLAEQTRVVERAIGLYCRTPRKGESSQPLGVAVAWNLVDKGLRLAPDELAAGWSAYHLRDTAWILRFRYISRNHAQVAQWECDPAAGTLVALNRLASDIGYVEAGRRYRPPSVRDAIAAAQVAPRPIAEPSEPRSVRRPAAKKAAVKKAAVKKAVVKKAVVKKVVSRPLVKKAAAKPGAAQKVAPRKVTRKKVVAKKAAAQKVVARKVVAKKAPRRAPASARARARPRSSNRTSGRPPRRHPGPAPVPRAAPVGPRPAPPLTTRPLRPLRATSNGPSASQPQAASPSPPPSPPVEPPAPPAAAAARQRPLVAVRRIDSRPRSFPPPPAQRVIRPAPPTPVERERRDADEDADEGVLVIQARRASD